MSLNIAIAGGGISGGLAAISLAQSGHQVSIYEPNPDAEAIGGFMTLWPNATGGLIELGLGDWVESCERLETSRMKTWRGETLKELPIGELAKRLGAPIICVARHRFTSVLKARLPEGAKLIREPVEGARMHGDKVHVTSPSGEADYDLLVIADGQQSRNRSLVVPSWPLKYQGRSSFHGLARMEDLKVRSNHFTEVHGRGQRFGYFRVSETHCGWYATVSMRISDIPKPEDYAAFLLEHYLGWPDPVTRLFELTDPARIRPIAIHTCKPLPSWHQGHMVLMGDAAHPMTPDLGQGACQAIEDALCLPRTLVENDTIEQALAAYQRQRHPRTARLMNQSRIIGKVSNFSNPLLVSLRFMMLKNLSAGKSLDGFESMIRPQAG